MNKKQEPTKNYFPVKHSVIESKEFKKLNLSAKNLYFIFCKLRNYYADENGVFFRSDRDLAKDTGMGTGTIWRARHELLRANFIRWKQGKAHISCRYQINDFDKKD